jgi:hypothetical protein
MKRKRPILRWKERSNPHNHGLVERVPVYLGEDEPTSYVRAQGQRATGRSAYLATAQKWRDDLPSQLSEHVHTHALALSDTFSAQLPRQELVTLLGELVYRWNVLTSDVENIDDRAQIADYKRYAHGRLRRLHTTHGLTYSPQREGAFFERL